MDCADGKPSLDSNLLYLLIMKMILCVAAMILAIVAVCVECHKWVLNLNAKVVFYFHLSMMVIAPVTQFVPLLVDYLRLVNATSDGCDFLISTSFMTSIPSSVIGYMQTASIVAFFIDRAIATIWSKYYDRMTSCYLGIVLNFSTSLFLTMIFVFLLAWPLSLTGTLPSSENFGTMIILAVCVVVELPTVVGFCILKRYNAARVHKISQTPGKTLSFRYQVRENLNVISQVIPLFSCHLLILLLCATGHALVYFFFSGSKPVILSIFFLAANEIMFYPLCISIYIIVCHILHLRVGGSVTFSQSQAERHFSHLNDIWTRKQEEERY